MECESCRECQRLGEFKTVRDWDVDSGEAALLMRALSRIADRRANADGSPSVIERIACGAAVLRVFYTECGPRALYVLGFAEGAATIIAAYSECGEAAVHIGSREAAHVAKWMGFSSLSFYSRRKGWQQKAGLFGFTRVGEFTYTQEV